MKQHKGCSRKAGAQHKRSRPIETWIHDVPMQVVCDPDMLGGEFKFPSESRKYGLLRIGVGYSQWVSVLATLYHEVFEAHLSNMGLCFHSDAYWSNGSDCRKFLHDHAEFTEVCERAARTINLCIRDIHAEWKAFHKKKRA